MYSLVKRPGCFICYRLFVSLGDKLNYMKGKEREPILRIAILDMYRGERNQGMRALRKCLSTYIPEHGERLEIDEFNVRERGELPDTSYNLYFSTGGPGSPLETGNTWRESWMGLMDKLMQHNQSADQKKYVFCLGYSFQVLVHHLSLAKITKRNSSAFGIFPVHKTKAGEEDFLMNDLPNPFYAVDSREWQIIQPNAKRLELLGAQVLCMEKERPHVPYPRSLMGIRFSDAVVGTMFHAEADPEGMRTYLKDEDKKNYVIKRYGLDKYEEMVLSLSNKRKVGLTFKTLIPQFLAHAIHRHIQS